MACMSGRDRAETTHGSEEESNSQRPDQGTDSFPSQPHYLHKSAAAHLSLRVQLLWPHMDDLVARHLVCALWPQLAVSGGDHSSIQGGGLVLMDHIENGAITACTCPGIRYVLVIFVEGSDSHSIEAVSRLAHGISVGERQHSVIQPPDFDMRPW